MQTYKVSVQWTMVAEIEIKAQNLELAMMYANSEPLPPGDYLTDSFTVDEEDTKRINPPESTLTAVND